jgi:hypothetical protein
MYIIIIYIFHFFWRYIGLFCFALRSKSALLNFHFQHWIDSNGVTFIQNYIQIRSVVLELNHADRRTDGRKDR